MRLLHLLSIPLISAALFSQEGALTLERLTKDVDAASSAVEPQRIFDTPEAKKLMEFIRADMEANQAVATLHFLRQQHDTLPSWQVAVEAVWSSYAGSAPTAKDVASLESLFAATIKPADHWLNYSSPRGWSDPYSFRRKLAKLILHARTGAPHDIEDEPILRDNPSLWLSQLKPAHPQADYQATSSQVAAAPASSPQSVQPAASKTAPQSKPPQKPSEAPASSTPWSIIVVLIVVAIGLLWLLGKNRK
jgi:hypothetical protein